MSDMRVRPRMSQVKWQASRCGVRGSGPHVLRQAQATLGPERTAWDVQSLWLRVTG